MYEKVSTKLNFVEREEKVLEFWKENKVFEKSNTLCVFRKYSFGINLA